MKAIKLTFFIVPLLFALNIKLSSGFLGDFQTYLTFALNLKDKFGKAYGELRGEDTSEEFEANLWGDRTQSYLEGIVSKVDKLSSALNVMNKKMNKKLDALEKMLNEMPEMINRQALMNDFSRSADRITFCYNTLQEFANEKESITKKRIERFIHDNIESQQKNGLEGILNDIESIIISPLNPDNLLAVMERIEERKYREAICGKTPAHIILYEFYLTIAGLEMLAMTSLATGYGLQESLNPEERADLEVNFLQKRMTERMARYANKFGQAMIRLYSSHRNCDPVKTPKRDVDFVEMWGLHGMVVVNEYGIMLKNTASCGRGCGALNLKPDNVWCHAHQHSWTKVNNGIPEDVKKCTSKRLCMGKMRNCWGAEYIEYCIQKNSTRRYEYLADVHMKILTEGNISKRKEIQTTSVNIRGKVSGCPDGFLDVWRNHQWPTDDVYGTFCQYCFCICDDHEIDSEGVHTVSLKPARSATKENKVVIGLRFAVFDDILHIQVEEGIIMKDYYLSGKNKRWVDLPKMNDDVKESRRNPDDAKLKIDVDFAVITDQYAFNFDEIKLPLERVMTGVKFGVVEESKGGFPKRLQIEIESMKYNYKTGKLEQGSEEWMKPEPIDHDSRLSFSKNSPLNTLGKSNVDSKPNNFVVLSESDITEDASQTVVPLFEAKNIGSIPNLPLAGLGINHRSPGNTAGYIEFTGYTANVGEFLDSTLGSYSEKVKEEKDEVEDDFEY